MQMRLHEQRQVKRRQFIKKISWWAAGVAGVGVLVWVVLASPLFALDPANITVTGAGSTINVADVRAILAEQTGTSLTRLDLGAKESQVLALNGVRAVDISRSWPNGLDVQLVAREPIATVPGVDGLMLVDIEGVVVGQVEAQPEHLPHVSAQVGDELGLAAALGVLSGLPADLSAQVSGLVAISRDDVRTPLVNGQEVRWGSAEQMPLKVAAVRALLEAAPEAQVIDVSSPELPITRAH